MTVQPKVSIVIPVYNGSDYLREAIDSALNQTYPNFEIVVVNDGSIDGGATERIALSYGDRIRYFLKENGGVASALNLAIVEMSGEYFSWLSHDDLYGSNKISSQMEALAKMRFPDTILYSDWASFSNDSDQIREIRMPAVAPEQFRYFLTTTNVLHGCTLLIPRRAFVACGIFDESLRHTQDYDLWFRMAERFLFTQIPKVLVKGRQHPSQDSVTMKQAALKEINTLVIGFTRKLTPIELTSTGLSSVCLAYAYIATSFWRRRFYSAALDASRMVIGNLHGCSTKAGVKSILILCWAVIYAGMRRLGRPLFEMEAKLGTWLKGNLGPVKYQLLRRGKRELTEKFSSIFSQTSFHKKLFRGNTGLSHQQTDKFRFALAELIEEFDIQSIMDAPCGDFRWMHTMQLGITKYLGVDIAQSLIEKNHTEYGNAFREFSCLNLMRDELPSVDLIFCRECLGHLSFVNIEMILDNFRRSGSRYLLTTTSIGRNVNHDLMGKDKFRTLNLQAAPFNFPTPLRLVNEKCGEGVVAHADESLGLWRVSDI